MLEKACPVSEGDPIELLSNDAEGFTDFDNVNEADLYAHATKHEKMDHCDVVYDLDYYLAFGTGYSGQNYDRGGCWYIDGCVESPHAENWDIVGHWSTEDGELTVDISPGSETGTYTVIVEEDDPKYYTSCRATVDVNYRDSTQDGGFTVSGTRYYVGDIGYYRRGDSQNMDFEFLIDASDGEYSDSFFRVSLSSGWGYIDLFRT